MKVIIPASGTGKRFISAGYKDTKPLINVTQSKKILDYVLDCFDRENDEFFIITSPATHDMIESYISTLNINIKHFLYNGESLGPVGCVRGVTPELKKFISDDDKVIVSYCDYGMEWDYSAFLDFIEDVDPDGAIPTYSGYHPHLEPKENVYAAAKTLNHSLKIYEVKEKYESRNKYDEFWSAGLYYFKTFNLMSLAFDRIVEAKDMLNNEYYVSLAYNHIIDKNIVVYNEIEKFYQFGTPKDFEEAKAKLNALQTLENDEDTITNTVILSAGKGERFLNLGFNQPKPFLPLGKTDLITNITNTFKNVKTNIHYVGSKAHEIFWRNYDVNLITPNKIGAAFSYIEGCKNIHNDTLIVPCDLIAKHITSKFKSLKKDADVIIFTADATEFARNNPNSFAWVDGEDNVIRDISIKKLCSSANEQMVLIGSFWVKENDFLIENIKEIFDLKFTVNGEYYLDNVFKHMLDKGLTVHYIKLEKYFSLGTPDEYKLNKYWIDGKFDE